MILCIIAFLVLKFYTIVYGRIATNCSSPRCVVILTIDITSVVTGSVGMSFQASAQNMSETGGNMQAET
jgi:hypothetical protein